MIPILKNGNETGEFKKTLADELLKSYQHELEIYIVYDGTSHSIPVWKFIERYLRIKDKQGRKIAFELNREQIDVYKTLCENKRKGKRMWLDILKARQLGMSTFFAGIYFTLTAFSPNKTACIIADIAEHATTLFRKYQYMYANLPKELKELVPTKKSNAKELIFDYGDGDESIIRIAVQGENAGRGDTCQYLHLSEVAFWDDIDDTLTSILQTVDIENDNSIVVLETTANGVNQYKDIWDQDVAGDGEYTAVFFAWWSHSEYVSKYTGFELTDHEKKIKQDYSLKDEQIAWYRAKYLLMHKNIDKLKQEHPSSPIEAFITSGISKFNMDLILQMKERVLRDEHAIVGEFECEFDYSLDGSSISCKKMQFVETETGYLKIYRKPNPTHHYCINNDPANGGEDYYAIVVWDNVSNEQAAVYHRNKCDADYIWKQMYCLAKYYNDALVSGETNTTSYLLQQLLKLDYKFLHQDQKYDDLTGRYLNKLGYKTETTNRNAQLEMFAIAFREKPTCINDYATLCEMENFQVVRNETTHKEKIQATNGSHDDLVMCQAGMFLFKHLQSSVPTNISEDIKQSMWGNPFRKQEKEVDRENVYQIWD